MSGSSKSLKAPKEPYDWAEYLIFMEGGEPWQERPAPLHRWAGAVLAVVIAAASYGISSVSLLVDPILLGMLLGLIAGNLMPQKLWIEGTSFAAKKILPFGVILLGSRLDFYQVVNLGGAALLMSAAVVLAGLVVVYLPRAMWGLERSFAMLLAIGTAICGGTAIVAVAPIIRARERDIVVGVGVVTLVGLAAMLLLPPLAAVSQLSERQFGVLAGLTIHQTPQVVAAGFAFGDLAGQTATVVKLARVCLLAPVSLLVTWWATRHQLIEAGGVGAKPFWRLVPGFAIGFLLMALARTLGLFPDVQMTWDSRFLSDEQGLRIDTALFLKLCSGFMLTIGMAGVGFQTRFSQFREVGLQPLIAAAGSSLIIAAGVFFAVRYLIP